MKVIGYIRVSRVGGREGDSFISPQLQRQHIEDLARREGLTIVDWFEELDASGGDNKRPLWNKAIELVEQGKVGGIAVWNLSRFSRSTRDFLNAWERIEAAGGRVYSATQQLDNKMLRTILMAIAEDERDRARDNFWAADMNALERGIWIASRIPYGYRRDENRKLVVEPEEAAIVRDLFERRAKGMSWRNLTLWANENGCPLTEKGIWHIVHSPTYLGWQRYGGEVKKDDHEAIVGKALFNRGQEKARKSQRPGTLTAKYLLQGIAVCDACGKGLYLSNGLPRAGNPDGAHYRCRNIHCPGPRAYATANALDSYVLNVVFGYEDDEVSVPALIDTVSPSTWIARPGGDVDLDEARIELEEAKANLDDFLANKKAITVLGADLWNQQAEEYMMAVELARETLERAHEQNEPGYELLGRLWLNEWGHAERAEWLARMIDRVIVRRAEPRGQALSQRVEVELR